MTRTVFVAGASGAIGSRLVPLLVQQGHRVIGLTRSPARAEDLRRLGAEPVLGDAFDARRLAALVVRARPDVVVHQLTDLPKGLASPPSGDALRRNARIRIEGTVNLVAAARRAGARMLIAQSIAWGYARGPLPHTEEHPLDMDANGPDGVTMAGVMALEREVLNAAPLVGIVLRYGLLYGPGTGAPDAGGRPYPLHVDAAAHAVLLAMARGRQGVYNIVEANPSISSAKAQRELGWQPGIGHRSTAHP